MDYTKSDEANQYQEAQAVLSRALNELNVSQSLPAATGAFGSKEEAAEQQEVIRAFIRNRKRAIEALEDALADVDFHNRIGYLENYLEEL